MAKDDYGYVWSEDSGPPVSVTIELIAVPGNVVKAYYRSLCQLIDNPPNGMSGIEYTELLVILRLQLEAQLSPEWLRLSL